MSVAGDASGDAPFAVESTIEVGAAPHGIRFSGDGDTVYVALSGDGQIAVVDLTRSEVVERWEAGTTPLDLIATAEGWLVTQFTDSTLLRLDREGHRIPGGVVEVGPGPSLFSPASVRDRAWVTLEFADRLVEGYGSARHLGEAASVVERQTGPSGRLLRGRFAPQFLH